MKTFKLRKFYQRLTAVAAAAAVAGVAMLVATATTPNQASAVSFNVYRDCSSNSVIKCGAMTTSEVQSKYNSEAGVKQIFAAYHISASDVASLGSTAVSGYATQSGDVVVNGKVVATHAFSAGRDPISGSTRASYGGVTFYNSPDQTAFLSSDIHGYVVMKNGQFAFMILASCGNPLNATPIPAPKPVPPKPAPKPVASLVCNSLTYEKQSDNEYTFTVQATAENVTNVSYSFNFGDGTKASDVSKSVTHTFTQSGTYTVVASVSSDQIKNVTSDKCAASVTIPPKPMCTIPGKENLPPNSPECQPTTVVVTTPPPTPPTTTLVNTGPGEILGIFAAAAAAAAIAARLFLHRRYQA